jgi:protein TonB
MRHGAATQLSPPTTVVATTTVAVLLLHVAALLVWQQKSEDEPLRKRPDLTVQFFTPAPLPATPAVKPTPTPQSVANPSEQPSRVAPAEPTQPDVVATTNPESTVTPLATVTPAESTPVNSSKVSEAAPPSLADTDADHQAAYLNNPRPPYPLSAVRQGAQGRVLLSVEVLPDGRAGRVRLEQSSGHALLDTAAMNTVRTWRFTPARKDGMRTTQAVRIPIDFTLQTQR